MRRIGNVFDGFLSRYNFTDFHELNLDWIILKIIELNETVENFVSLNTIKYADPIQWNITTQYEANTVVIDPATGTAYLSTKPVPAGVAISNPDYWTVIFDLKSIIDDYNDNLTFHNDGDSTTATFASATGDWIILNDELYKVIADIAIGTAYTVGTNIERKSVEELMNEYRTSIYNYIGNLLMLDTTDKSSIVNAINELVKFTDLEIVTPQMFGALGDGVTDDTQAFQDAIDHQYAKGGGIVYVPATGTYYLTSDVINVKAGVMLLGVGVNNFDGVNASPEQWGRYGSWIKCTSTTAHAIRIYGHGAGMKGINLIFDQPVPTGMTYTPITYPSAIYSTANQITLEDIFIIACSVGIELFYDSNHGGGGLSHFKNIIISAFDCGVRVGGINDQTQWENIQVRPLFYPADASIVSYMLNNLIGIDFGYFDNSIMHGLQLSQCHYGMYFRDELVLGNTHSVFNSSINDVQFNLVYTAMKCENSTTTVWFQGSNYNVGGDINTFQTATLFSLLSSNVNIMLSNVWCPTTGGSFMELNGKMTISNLDIAEYSTIGSGLPCFGLDSNAQLRLNGYSIKKHPNSGVIFTGPGYERVYGTEYYLPLFFQYPAVYTNTGVGNGQIITAGLALNPKKNYTQGRILGHFIITTPQSSGTARFYLANYNEIQTPLMNASVAGDVAFDSGWIDLSSPESAAGILYGDVTPGVVYTFQPLELMFR